jgi:hypothetical protein
MFANQCCRKKVKKNKILTGVREFDREGLDGVNQFIRNLERK